jgi:hypothetical protein
MFANNLVVDSGLKTPAFPAIHLYGGSAHVVAWNKIGTSGAKVHSKSCFADASQSSSFYGNDCSLESTGVVVIASPGPRSIPGTAPPTSGSWVVGDRILNVKAAKGHPQGWICTSSGTPGEWVPMSNISKAP